jgi:hypothetical protein
MRALAVLLVGALSLGPIEWDAARVDMRVAAWQPTARERAWERIRWAPDIATALRLAKASSRPVFLYTHDGRLGVGRC